MKPFISSSSKQVAQPEAPALFGSYQTKPSGQMGQLPRNEVYSNIGKPSSLPSDARFPINQPPLHPHSSSSFTTSRHPQPQPTIRNFASPVPDIRTQSPLDSNMIYDTSSKHQYNTNTTNTMYISTPPFPLANVPPIRSNSIPYPYPQPAFFSERSNLYAYPEKDPSLPFRAANSPTKLQKHTNYASDSEESSRKVKRNRVSQACLPCQKAHMSCNSGKL
jgi:hypothetical protein